MELVNTHCHCVYSGHGVGSVAEYADAAAAAGLTTLAFTEHFPLSAAFDPDRYLSMTEENLPRYLAEIEAARAAHPSVEFIVGTEMDYLGDLEDRAQRSRWEEPGAPDAIWRRYGELWCEAAVNRTNPYDAMSHPDLAKKFGFYPTFDLGPFYEAMAEAARAGERMVEVNTSGAYYACAEMFPAPALLAAFRRAGVPCTVGCDSHDPANVARDIRRAYDLMYEAGYRSVTVPTATGDRRSITIE